MNMNLSTGGEWHPLTWLWTALVGLVAYLDANVLPHFVLWGSAGLVALGYLQKWRSKRDRSQDGTHY